MDHDYGTSGSINDRLHRLAAIKESATQYIGYEYNGMGRMMRAGYPQIDLRLTYEHADDDGDCEGFDRFDRMIDHRSALERQRLPGHGLAG